MRDTGLGVIDQPHRTNWIRRVSGGEGLERIEAFFDGKGYEMHRHDTYAIGLTLSGVQSFHYRGRVRHGLAGGALVLHPDEKHDGQAGTEGGFRYRMLYIEPAMIQAALGGQPLPFVEGGLSADARLLPAIARLLSGLDRALDPLEREDGVYDLAMALACLSKRGPEKAARIIDHRSAERARSFLHSRPAAVDLGLLERLTGRDRWSLSRDFRALFGTSPYRYLVLRRLDDVRALMRAGHPLADAAAASGFSDQSHMTRHFKSAFGLTPSQWLRLQSPP
ncbi:AraC family transcriptional regulator [Aureimonas sp. ME7]|uniref:AraC family transcriptional regulator n=1 Tax=Aureimonas sp. ME7 TaxID=2744252 RepID=UPI001FCE9487|nr:AraC family transcriptional regulator [Aureimonas sp. ME7]